MTNNIPIYNRNTVNYGEVQNTFVTSYFSFFFYQQTVISFGGNKIARVMEAGFQVRSKNTATFVLTRQFANRL